MLGYNVEIHKEQEKGGGRGGDGIEGKEEDGQKIIRGKTEICTKT